MNKILNKIELSKNYEEHRNRLPQQRSIIDCNLSKT